MAKKADVGVTLGVDGAAQFRKSMADASASVKTLGAQMAMVTSAFLENDDAARRLQSQNNVLTDSLSAMAHVSDVLKARLEELDNAGVNPLDASYQKLLKQLYDNETAMNKTQAQISANEEEMQRLTEVQNENAESTGGLSGLMKTFGVDLDGVARSLGLSREQTSVLSDALGGGGLSLAAGAAAAAGAIALAAAAVKEITEFMADAVSGATDYADNISTLSTNFHIAAGTLQEYQYMAELTDTSLDTITGSISRLTKSMDKARDGNEDLSNEFAKLNVRVTDSNGELRDSSEVFLEVIDGLGRIGNETERDAVAMAIFGKSAMELNSLVAAGSAGINQFAQEARDMGYVLSDEEVNSLRQLDDEFVRFDNQMTAIKNQIAAEMAPALIELAQQLLDVAQTVDWREFGQSAGNAIRDLTPLIVEMANAVANAAQALAELLALTGASYSASAKGTYGKDGMVSGARYQAAMQTAAAATQQSVTLKLDGYTVGKATTPYVNQQNYAVGKIL